MSQYLTTQERIKTRAIYAIFKTEKAIFADLLDKQDKKRIDSKRFTLERKITEEDLVDPFLDEIAPYVPEYLVKVLPNIMNQGAKVSIKRYKDLLPK